MNRTWHRNAALILPLLLVNSAAVYGQAGWAYDHLGHNWIVAVLFALAVESIGVFLAAEAHAALMAGHASGTLRLGSYAVGALVGALNYAHFAGTGYRPNPLAVTFGLLSSISPWLWSIRSRSMNRARLYELGLIDPRAVKFSRLRWTLFPLRTFAAFRAAVWAGIQRPDEAVAAADARRVARRAGHRGAPVVRVVGPVTDDPAQVPLTAHVPAVALAQVRRTLSGLSADSGADTRADILADTKQVSAADTTPDTKADKPAPRKRTPARTSDRTAGRTAKADIATAARKLRDRHPEWQVADIARRLNVTDRTVRRHLNGTPIDEGSTK